MSYKSNPQFRIYPSLGVARLGNGPAKKDQVVFAPEVPMKNLYETDNQYLTAKGEIKKQAQRFYIYECDDTGKPVSQINPEDYDITWSVEVANKKPFWYTFNNCLDLSILSDNQNLSPEMANDQLAPSIPSGYRNPNVLTDKTRSGVAYNYRKELVNHPPKISVDAHNTYQKLAGQFPGSSPAGERKLLSLLQTKGVEVDLGSIEFDDDGTLIFYAADGISASLNPSDLNTNFADNANWYDDTCDGRITAVLTPKNGGNSIALEDARSAAWVTTAPPDYAPQIQPISTLFDLIVGAANEEQYADLGPVFSFLYRLYRMQWVNLGDFLSPSFKEFVDELIAKGEFKYIYTNDGSAKAQEVRNSIFELFRSPAYPLDKEPIIPSKEQTNIENRGDEVDPLKLPYYPGDGIDYPGSPAQWFAIPPVLYDQFKNWRDGKFEPLPGNFADMDAIGKYYQQQFLEAANDDSKKPLLMTRAVLETLYGGGFHPGVELTWPMRHANIYAENDLTYSGVGNNPGLFGLREIRINAAPQEIQDKIFYNDFGFQINPQDIKDSMEPGHEKKWLWQITPGDLTKWMGIPWQSDAGSCQAIFTEQQYPTPAWWAANLPVYVLTEENYEKLQDESILPDTRKNIYANRLAWLHTTDTGYVGYHAVGGYTNGLIAMVYKWKNIGMVTGRKLDTDLEGIPDTVYVALNGVQKKS